MKKIVSQKHFLALMNKPGDCVYIDTSRLDISGGVRFETLKDIDYFTMRFTNKEIVDAIKRANIAPLKYLEGKLVIQDNMKHNPMAVIDKELYNNFNIDEFLSEAVNDKVKINNLVNKFRSVSKDIIISNSFERALKNKNVIFARNILFNLDYLKIRKYIVYLLENNKEKIIKVPELKRDKAS